MSVLFLLPAKAAIMLAQIQVVDVVQRVLGPPPPPPPPPPGAGTP